MNRSANIMTAAALSFAPIVFTAPAVAKCADEIKALEGKAAGADAVNNPGQNKPTGNPETTADKGGGTRSASEIILRAKAFNEKGDEAECLKAVKEAKTATGSK